MNKTQIQRFATIHRAIATSLQEQLARHWLRELTAEEASIVESYTLCGSFMRLEAIENSLMRTTSGDLADQEFSFMRSEVVQNASEVTRMVRARLPPDLSTPDPAMFSSLLTWEEAIVECFP
ncbi:MAG: hypothetical protein HY273_15895 [Gammaproteobacteria bacterium]|nr:hypothetical protein [Gammaproteobacteria bacterium]